MSNFEAKFKGIMENLEISKGDIEDENLGSLISDLEGDLFKLKFRILDKISVELDSTSCDSEKIYNLACSYDLLGGIDFNEPF